MTHSRDDLPDYSGCCLLQPELDKERENDITLELAGFYSETVIVLRRHPSLVTFARTVQSMLDRFVTGCDIRSPVPLEDQLEQDEKWRDLIESVAEDPLKYELALDIRDGELGAASEKIADANARDHYVYR
jgi:hypothetical protein